MTRPLTLRARMFCFTNQLKLSKQVGAREQTRGLYINGLQQTYPCLLRRGVANASLVMGINGPHDDSAFYHGTFPFSLL